jgi:hypothetical protein
MLRAAFDQLYGSYKQAILSSGLPEADEAYVAKVGPRLPGVPPPRAGEGRGGGGSGGLRPPQ